MSGWSGGRRVTHAVADDVRTVSIRNGWPGARSLCGAVMLRLATMVPTTDPVQITCYRCSTAMIRAQHGKQPPVCSVCGWDKPYRWHVCTKDGGRAAGVDDGERRGLNRPARVREAMRLAIGKSAAAIKCAHPDRPVEETRDVHYEGMHAVMALCGPCAFLAETSQPVPLKSGQWVRVS